MLSARLACVSSTDVILHAFSRGQAEWMASCVTDWGSATKAGISRQSSNAGDCCNVDLGERVSECAATTLHCTALCCTALSALAHFCGPAN